jgi:HD-GYP domain-containing protein (c-di-GMP phosphodiesterase class II)
VGIPDAILMKSGPLEPGERALMEKHPVIGEGLCGDLRLLKPVRPIVRSHHERLDGTGYPDRLRGDSIPLLAQMMGIVDVFDALTTKRPYADAMSPSNALNFLQKLRGSAFHPLLVEQFTRCIGFFPVGSAVELNSGEVGIVISQNMAKRLQPRVMVVRDAKGGLIRPQKLLDLAKLPKLTADEPYRIRRTLEYGRAGVTAKDVMMT